MVSAHEKERGRGGAGPVKSIKYNRMRTSLSSRGSEEHILCSGFYLQAAWSPLPLFSSLSFPPLSFTYHTVAPPACRAWREPPPRPHEGEGGQRPGQPLERLPLACSRRRRQLRQERGGGLKRAEARRGGPRQAETGGRRRARAGARRAEQLLNRGRGGARPLSPGTPHPCAPYTLTSMTLSLRAAAAPLTKARCFAAPARRTPTLSASCA